MEQITLVFLIGAFALFLIQMKWRHEFSIKIMGFFASVSVVALSLMDADLIATPEWMTVMVVTGFAFTLFFLVRMLEK